VQNAKDKVLADVAPKIESKPEVIEIVNEPTTAEAALIDQTKEEVEVQQAQSTPEEDEARQITDAAIKKYWTAKEKERTAPRAHQQDLSLHEKVLREFDMSAQYGVSYHLHQRRIPHIEIYTVANPLALTIHVLCSLAPVSLA
jgi:DNA polymerase delta subunit 4